MSFLVEFQIIFILFWNSCELSCQVYKSFKDQILGNKKSSIVWCKFVKKWNNSDIFIKYWNFCSDFSKQASKEYYFFQIKNPKMAKLPHHFISNKQFQKYVATLVGISLSPAPPFGCCLGKASFYLSPLVNHTWTSTTFNIVSEN